MHILLCSGQHTNFRQSCNLKHLIIFFLKSLWIQFVIFTLSVVSYLVFILPIFFVGYKSQLAHPHQFCVCVLVIDALSALVLNPLVFNTAFSNGDSYV